MAPPAKIVRNPEQTRQRILDAAIEEFSQRTLDGARVEAIAVRAGVNKRMLYHYFGDKEHLFIAALDSVFARARPYLQGPIDLADDPREALSQMVERVFGFFAENPRVTRIIDCVNLHRGRHLERSENLRGIMDARIEQMAAILERGRKTGVFRDDADPKTLVLMMTGMTFFFIANSATFSVFLDDDLAAPETRAAWCRHIVEFLFRAAKA